MKITTEQIERFFKKQSAPGEAEQVATFLKSNPAILEKYLNESEWNEAHINTFITDTEWNEAWESIRKKKRLHNKIVFIKRSATAACLAGLMIFGFYMFNKDKNEVNIEASKTTGQQKLLAETHHKIITNTSSKPISFLLQDGSDIVLSPRSLVKYDVPFAPNKREIFLEGEAIFKVAKDRAKPFTVYAGGLATTALGTKFKITANPSQQKTTVKLFEGKVVIRSADEDLKEWNKDVYLLPGQQMEYNTSKNLLAVTTVTADKPVATKQKKNTSDKEDTQDAGLNFNSTPLPEVMEKLSAYYFKKIEFNKAEIDSMNFTGSISKKDSLSIVLKVIAQMNDLFIEQNDDGFIIQKTTPE